MPRWWCLLNEGDVRLPKSTSTPLKETFKAVSQLMLGLGKDVHTFASFIHSFNKYLLDAGYSVPGPKESLKHAEIKVLAIPWGSPQPVRTRA